MKNYIAIGHYKESANITCAVSPHNSLKAFRSDLKGNEFVPYVILTEKKFYKLMTLEDEIPVSEIKKLTTNYRVWNDVIEYLEQCSDIIESKLNKC